MCVCVHVKSCVCADLCMCMCMCVCMCMRVCVWVGGWGGGAGASACLDEVLCAGDEICKRVHLALELAVLVPVLRVCEGVGRRGGRV